MRIEVRRVSSHRGAVRNGDIALHSVLQGSTCPSGRHRMARMRKPAARDAHILRSSADHNAVMDVCRRLLVANVVDIALCDIRAAHRQQLHAGHVCVMRLHTFDLQIVDESAGNRRLISRVKRCQRGNREIRQRYVLQHGDPRGRCAITNQIAVINLVIERNLASGGVDGFDLLDLTSVLLRVFGIDRFVGKQQDIISRGQLGGISQR